MTNTKKQNTIAIKQIGSSAGLDKRQVRTLKGLGLGKIGKVRQLPQTSAVLGMVKKLPHVVKICETK